MKLIENAIQIFLMLLPWGVRRRVLCAVFGFRIHPSARIGYSIVRPMKLTMAECSRIGHLTVVKGLEELRLDRYAKLGHLNWVTGFPLGRGRFFSAFPNRYPCLHLKEHASIQRRSLVDCTDQVTVGEFSLLAGYRHQILTHSIDLETANQACAPVSIGAYCFIGTGCIFLKGSGVPDYSVLGAGSVLHKRFHDEGFLYSGVPATAVRSINRDMRFFTRVKGDSD